MLDIAAVFCVGSPHTKFRGDGLVAVDGSLGRRTMCGDEGVRLRRGMDEIDVITHNTNNSSMRLWD
jgi:hypothetical protein